MLGILIYSLYIIFDTQFIIGQIGLAYNIDDYCLAALNLYIVIILLCFSKFILNIYFFRYILLNFINNK